MVMDLKQEAKGLIVSIMRFLKDHQGLSRQCLEHVCSLLHHSGLSICAIKAVFVLNASDMFTHAIKQLKESDEVCLRVNYYFHYILYIARQFSQFMIYILDIRRRGAIYSPPPELPVVIFSLYIIL